MHAQPRTFLRTALGIGLGIGLFLFLFVSLFTSCGEGEVEGAAEAGQAEAGASRVERRVERVESEAARDLRLAIEAGRLEELEVLFDEVGVELGMELELLHARVSSLRGEEIKVTTLIEAARAMTPEDPRVYATAAELHAASGRLETARDELNRGIDACGMSPELLRAQGVIELCRQGGAERGLALVERALEVDPELPFTARLRGQAHLLLGKRALAEQRTRAALDHARRSVEHDPNEIDAWVFLADALASNGELPDAVRVLEQLEADGHGRGAELALMYKRAAVGELVLKQRDRALEFFRLARQAGLDDEQLGSGADMLTDAAAQASEDGRRAFEAGELATAELRFEHALRLDDSLLVVRSQLAVALFQQKKFLPAATQWRHVLDETIALGFEAPDPVHIYLAKALVAAGEREDARRVLEEYLARETEGHFRAPTAALLEELR